MKVIRYTLDLRQPVLTTDVLGDPNSAVSLPYITGALLRGAIVSLYLNRLGRKTFDTLDAEARALFLSETTRYLNAYPLSEDGKRALPTPAAWRHDKEDRHTEEDEYRTIYDLSRGVADIREQAVGAPFCWLDGGEASLYTPPRQVNLHTQRDARKGRATEEEGAVYRYDALAAGLRLQAAIVTTADCAPKLLDMLSHQTLWLGRARRAGYGEACVTVEKNPLDFWRESGTDDDPPAIESGEPLHITFTSDALLRDSNGQATLDPCHALEGVLNVLPDSLKQISQHCWAETKIVGGFNRKWGLPLPQTVALAAGSVFVYQANEPIEAKKLRELERDGIGERRNEGFGRVLINWPGQLSERFESRLADPSFAPEPEKLSEEEVVLAKAIGRRMLWQQMDAELRNRVNYTKLERPPHNNQLARLRLLLREAQAGYQTIESLMQFRNELRDTARKQFERARIVENGKSINWFNWFDEQLEKAEQKWARNPLWLGKGALSIPIEVDADLAREYALRLIDQVLYRATKAVAEEERD